jgi:ferrochelatase
MHAKVKELVDVPVSLAMRYGNPSLLSGLQELHDQGVTEVMLSLCTQHAMASTTTILELAEDHRKSIFQKIYDSSCLYNKPDYLQNLPIL